MNQFFRACWVAACSVVFLYGCATVAPSPPPAKLTGGMLTDLKSMTLYTFDRDVVFSGKSACNGECAVNWLPFYAPSGAKPDADFQVIKRDDGKAQWAFKGKPLYYWPEDQEPGDKYGEGYRNLWRLITAAGPITVMPSDDSEGY